MTGSELIAQERARQLEVEGWDPKHDDEHCNGELAWGAVCYAAPAPVFRGQTKMSGLFYRDPWPWDKTWDKRGKTTRIRDLVKAGALIAAEIDRLQRDEANGG